jgi:hypothetical protein
VGCTAFIGTVSRKRSIPFRPIGAPGRDEAGRHPTRLFCAGVELGHLFSRVQEEPCNRNSARLDHDEIPRWLLMLRAGVRAGRLASEALTHGKMLPWSVLPGKSMQNSRLLADRRCRKVNDDWIGQAQRPVCHCAAPSRVGAVASSAMCAIVVATTP